VDRQVRRIYRVYYLIRALHIFAQSACLSILVIYAQTFLGNENRVFGLLLSKSQLVLVLVLSNYFCEALLELLTGQYADRSGRANAVKAYSVCYFLSAICCAAVISYPPGSYLILEVLLVGQAFRALGASFLNGALESWAVDSLRYYQRETESTRLFTVSSWIVGLMWLLGGTVALIFKPADLENTTWLVTLPFLLIAVLMVIVFIVAYLFMGEDYLDEDIERVRKQALLPFLRNSLQRASWRKNRNVFLLTLGFAGGYALWLAIADLWSATYRGMSTHLQPTIKDAATLRIEFAWIVFCVARFGGSAFATSFMKEKLSGRRGLIGATMLNMIPIGFAGFLAQNTGGRLGNINVFLMMIMLSKLGEETVKPIRTSLLNDNISHMDSAYRATLNSLGTFIGAALATVGMGAVIWMNLHHPAMQEYILYGRAFVILSLFSVLSLSAYVALRAPNKTGVSVRRTVGRRPPRRVFQSPARGFVRRSKRRRELPAGHSFKRLLSRRGAAGDRMYRRGQRHGAAGFPSHKHGVLQAFHARAGAVLRHAVRPVFSVAILVGRPGVLGMAEERTGYRSVQDGGADAGAHPFFPGAGRGDGVRG
jgi:MFS family permease